MTPLWRDADNGSLIGEEPMEEHETLLAELQGIRERAAGLLRAKLDAVAQQVRDAAARTVGELDLVLPPDPEVLFPVAPLGERIASLTAPVVVVGPELELLRALDAGRAQSEVLQEFLGRLEPWCGPRGIVVFREGRVAGWSGAGFGEGDPVRGWQADIGGSAAFARVGEGAPTLLVARQDDVLQAWLPEEERTVLLVPMSLRGKVVGSVVAVLKDDAGAPIVQLLTYLVGLLLETLAVRPQVPTPALRAAEALPASALGPPAPLPAAEAVEGEEPAAERADDAAAAPVEVAPPPVVEEAPVEEVVAEEAEAVEEPAAEKEEAPSAPVEVAGPEVEEEGPLEEVVEAAAAPELTPEDQRRHDEARRFARLLVSEIRLYNEQAVQDGKANQDIYQRLKDDIDRSREMYEQRVPAEIRSATNYFFEELVRTLADGDPDALGL